MIVLYRCATLRLEARRPSTRLISERIGFDSQRGDQMPICAVCGDRFPNRMEVEGRVRILNRRRYCLNCSPFGKHNTVALKVPVPVEKPEATCTRCGRKYLYDRTKGHRKRVCNSCNANSRRSSNKERAVSSKGGGCNICGYNRCLGSLIFHHLDPKKKDFSLSAKEFCRAWAVLERELNKCVLLCANCHGEVHAGLVRLPRVGC